MNIFELLTDDELSMYTYVKNYKAGDVIFNEDALCEKIGYLEKGEINIVEITYTEKEETITYLNDGSFFGDILLFSKNPTYLGHAICLKKSIVRYITKDHILILFEKNKAFLNAFLSLISTKALMLKQEIKLFKHKNITDRVIYYLNNEQKKYPNQIVPIKNITTMAKILSIPRVSLTRELSKLERLGIITKNKDNHLIYIKLKNQ